MKIVYNFCNTEKNVLELLDEFQDNGWDLNNEYHKIVHTGDCYVIFYDVKLETKREFLAKTIDKW